MVDPAIIGSWTEYGRLVVSQLESLRKEIERLNSKIDDIQVDQMSSIWAQIAVLQFKAGLWGALAGAIPGCVAAIYFILKKTSE